MGSGKYGRFEIKSLLGKGAMGAVYSARDPMLNREVAIKVVRFPDNMETHLLEKAKKDLFREAQLAARLSHPGIVQVYDAGDQEGEPYIVLELIRGHLLSDLIKEKGKLDLTISNQIFRQLLDAMAYAHKNGIVHLDLKPANIMIGRNRQPRIMDFGIARSVSDLRRQEEEIRGTPKYMAPEQVQGGDLDPRTDVFSLGVIFYQMMSGHLPFPAKNIDELLAAIVGRPHYPLQTRQSDLPKSYCELVDTALSKSPIYRFDSAEAMLETFTKNLDRAEKVDANGGHEELSDGGRQEILRFIMQRIKRKGDFPSISQYVSEVVRAARSPKSTARGIAGSILKDVSLTNRVLRIANSAFYRTHGPPITTITRAVVVLGMDAILNMTSALGIFEHFLKGSDIEDLKKQVVKSLFTALNARDIANNIGMENSEEPFICGMLHHLGRLIVSFYFPEEQKAIDKLIREEEVSEEVASKRVMRLSYSELSQGIAESWNLPELLQSGLNPIDPSRKGPLRGKEERLRGITAYASELSEITMITDPEQRSIALGNLSRKYQGKINLKPKALAGIVKDSLKNASKFSRTIHVNLKTMGLSPEPEAPSKEEAAARQTADIAQTRSLSDDDQTITMSLKNIDADGTNGSTAPRAETVAEPGNGSMDESDYKIERQEFLTKTITDIAMTLTGAFSISDVIMMVLEGMFRGLGMQNVFLAMVTPKRDRLVYRFGLGPQTERLRTEFDCRLKPAKTAMAAVISRHQEISIPDTCKIKSNQLMPMEVFNILNPKSLVMIPLVVRKTAIGLFVAIRSKEQPAITELDLQSVRMLVNQCILALHQSSR